MKDKYALTRNECPYRWESIFVYIWGREDDIFLHLCAKKAILLFSDNSQTGREQITVVSEMRMCSRHSSRNYSGHDLSLPISLYQVWEIDGILPGPIHFCWCSLGYTHLPFFFPGICIKATPYFHCPFGERDQTCDTHIKQKQAGFINKAQFWLTWPWLSSCLIEQPGTNALTACKDSALFACFGSKDKASNKALVRSNARLLAPHSHVFPPSAVLQNLCGKIFACDKLRFYEFPKP